MNPKWIQNGFKMDPTWVHFLWFLLKFTLKMQHFYRRTLRVPKRCPKSPHEPTIGPKCNQNGFKMDPK
jgi:hypothetical protein